MRLTEMAERRVLAFERISDFKGTNDKREFQPYAVVFFITLLIINCRVGSDTDFALLF